MLPVLVIYTFKNADNLQTVTFETGFTGFTPATIGNEMFANSGLVLVYADPVLRQSMGWDPIGPNNIGGKSDVYMADQTAPTITLISPSANTSVNTSAVGYTLSETIASGSVKWEQTGGTNDGNSPHTVALTLTELDVGTTSKVLTNAPTLVNGAIYTITFNGTDAAGNVATQVSIAGILFDSFVEVPTINTITTPIKYTTPTFTGTGDTGDTITLYGGSTNLGTVVVSNNAWSITPSAMSEGTYLITATATDPVGNISDPSTQKSLVIDTTDPTISSVSTDASDNDYLKAGESIPLTATMSEDVLINGTIYATTNITNSGSDKIVTLIAYGQGNSLTGTLLYCSWGWNN